MSTNLATVQSAPPRPTLAASKPFKEVKTITEALQHPEMVTRMRQAVPRHLSPERMMRVLALAVQKTPKLGECDLMTLLGAMMVCASLGLEPNTPLGHAYLIPFNGRRKDPQSGRWVDIVEVQLIIGYRGYIELARRSGGLVSIHADVVYPGDEFSFEYGSNQHLRHVPTGSREAEPIWAYCHAKLTDGEAFGVMPYAEVLKIRNQSQGYRTALQNKGAAEDWKRRSYESNPWVAHEYAMACKTMVRSLSKVLPMSIEFASAAELDAMSDAGRADYRSLASATSIVDMVDQAALEAPAEEPVGFAEEAMRQDVKAEPVERQAPQQQAARTRQSRRAEPAQEVVTISLTDADGQVVDYTLPGEAQAFENDLIAQLGMAAAVGPEALAGLAESNGTALDQFRAAGFAEAADRILVKCGEHGLKPAQGSLY